ncbi:hypothetical protein BaRGS_00038117 [Batillaria attramentaria]|uniref:Uncharacterized protein n=1 Tax=Batillaria attramentaria TaxID=370345 RepID=A0ABD0J715_9CAEN
MVAHGRGGAPGGTGTHYSSQCEMDKVIGAGRGEGASPSAETTRGIKEINKWIQRESSILSPRSNEQRLGLIAQQQAETLHPLVET